MGVGLCWAFFLVDGQWEFGAMSPCLGVRLRLRVRVSVMERIHVSQRLSAMRDARLRVRVRLLF